MPRETFTRFLICCETCIRLLRLEKNCPWKAAIPKIWGFCASASVWTWRDAVIKNSADVLRKLGFLWLAGIQLDVQCRTSTMSYIHRHRGVCQILSETTMVGMQMMQKHGRNYEHIFTLLFILVFCGSFKMCINWSLKATPGGRAKWKLVTPSFLGLFKISLWSPKISLIWVTASLKQLRTLNPTSNYLNKVKHPTKSWWVFQLWRRLHLDLAWAVNMNIYKVWQREYIRLWNSWHYKQ